MAQENDFISSNICRQIEKPTVGHDVMLQVLLHSSSPLVQEHTVQSPSVQVSPL